MWQLKGDAELSTEPGVNAGVVTLDAPSFCLAQCPSLIDTIGKYS